MLYRVLRQHHQDRRQMVAEKAGVAQANRLDMTKTKLERDRGMPTPEPHKLKPLTDAQVTGVSLAAFYPHAPEINLTLTKTACDICPRFMERGQRQGELF
ncbi:Conserved hypothetical protein [Pseudomonas veronii 1YdBTEX2]|uniref:Uncharacterized protein n=1 Tax=Pseudomonas veronii 1YdBTEX2 TaxID=1295141 RepID=A0A1D3K742_PSEVE|nr:Conserved hypothetical protein [Pseudomonas veronii 1YdBTEX2]